MKCVFILSYMLPESSAVTYIPKLQTDHQESQQLCPHQVVQEGENHEKHAELVMDSTSQPMKTAA